MKIWEIILVLKFSLIKPAYRIQVVLWFPHRAQGCVFFSPQIAGFQSVVSCSTLYQREMSHARNRTRIFHTHITVHLVHLAHLWIEASLLVSQFGCLGRAGFAEPRWPQRLRIPDEKKRGPLPGWRCCACALTLRELRLLIETVEKCRRFSEEKGQHKADLSTLLLRLE